MPIRTDQLREKEDYQKLILEHLEADNKFRIRPNTAYKPGLAMDTEILLEFLEDTQYDAMEKLRHMYKDRTNETVINYINSEINKDSRGLIDVIKHGVEFDNGVTLKLMYRKPDSTINTRAVENCRKNIFSVMEEYTIRLMNELTLLFSSTVLRFLRWNSNVTLRAKATKTPSSSIRRNATHLPAFSKAGLAFLPHLPWI